MSSTVPSCDGPLYVFPLGDDVVCLDTRTGRLRVANAVGAAVWYRWAQDMPLDQTIAALSALYDVERHQLECDVRNLYAELDHDAEFRINPVPDHEPILDPAPARSLHDYKEVELVLPGLLVRARAEEHDISAELQALFPLSVDDVGLVEELTLDIYSARDRFPIVHESRTLDTGLTVGDAVVKAQRELCRLASRRSPWTAIVHASAVAKNGRAVLFPAVGGSGKTTLAAWLTAHGWSLLNDDTVPLLAGTGHLRPTPVALSVKPGSWNVLAPHWPSLLEQPVHGHGATRFRYVPVNAERCCLTNVPCALIVLPRYAPELDEDAVFKPVAPSTVLRDIVEGGCVVDKPLRPAQVETLTRWIETRPCLRLIYSDVDAARHLLEKEFP